MTNEQTSMNIIRTNKRENPYVMVDKTGLEDNRISWKAKGLLVYLLSKPDDWVFYEAHLINQSPDGRDSVRAGLKELEKFGYIRKDRTTRNEKGKFKSGMNMVVYETPLTAVDGKSDEPLTENPSTENPTTENPLLVINDLTKNDLKKKDRKIDSAVRADIILNLLKIFEKKLKGIKINEYETADDRKDEYITKLIHKYGIENIDEIAVARACDIWNMRQFDYKRLKNAEYYEIKSPVNFFINCYEEVLAARLVEGEMASNA